MGEDVRLGVVGGGLMGAGIAEVAVRAGVNVVVVEATEDAATAAGGRIARSVAKAVERGKIEQVEHDTALARLRVTTDLGALGDCNHVVEAIVEDETAKTGLFRRLDDIAPADALLATNTSSIPVTRLARATSRPGSVMGVHFFNPVPVLPLVELIPTELTDETTKDRARAFVEDTLGKTAIWCPDRAGFVVNALLIPFMLSAIRMVESGVATAEDVDKGMVLGCNHPMGPLALADLVGLDTTLAVAETLHDEFREPHYAPPVLLRRKVEAGLLGRKTGRGFYEYED